MPKAAPYLLAWSTSHQSYTLTGRAKKGMLDILPDELVRTQPRLCFSQVLLLVFTGQLAEALQRLQDAEQSASHITPAEEAQAFLNQVATVQAYILFIKGDLATSVALAEQASDQLAERPVQVQEATSVIAAHRLLVSGDVRRVGEQFVARYASPRSGGCDGCVCAPDQHLAASSPALTPGSITTGSSDL